MKSEKQKKSKLALAIESRKRRAHDFDIQGFFGLGDKEIHKVAIRINTKSEEDASVVAAHKYAASFRGDGTQAARKDGDILTDGKAIEALFRACRTSGDEESEYDYPAFPGPTWMRDHMTTDQIATLLNLYQEVRRVEAPVPWTITIPQVMQLAGACNDAADTNVPDEMLAQQSKEWIAQAFILLSQRLFLLIKTFELQDKVNEWFFPVDDEEEESEDGLESEGEPEGHSEGVEGSDSEG